MIICQCKRKSCKCICKHVLIMCDIFHLFLFRLACACLCWQSSCVNHITRTGLLYHSEAQTVEMSKQNPSGSREQSISSVPRQKDTAPALPKIFFLHPGNSSLWELQTLSQRGSEQGAAGAPPTISPSGHGPASPLQQHLLCQMGWEPTLSSYVSLAPAHPQTKRSKPATSARPIYTLKCTACLSVSSHGCGVLGVYPNQITAGVRLG